MCFCGFPASILGYKRFPNVLWGPEYRKRLTQLGSLDAIVSGASGAVAASGSNSGRTGGTGNVVDEAMCAPAKWNKEGGTANPGSNSARITPMTGAAAQGSPVTEKTYNPTVNQPSPGAPLGSGGGTGVVMIAPRALSPSSNHPPGTYYNSPAPSTTTNASADSTPYNVASPPNYGNGQGVMMSPPSVGRPHFHGHQTPHHYAAVPQHASPNPALYQQGVGHRPSMSGGFALSPHRQQHQQLMQTPPPHIQNAGPYAPQPTQSAGYRG